MADIGVVGDTITAIEAIAPEQARRVVDVSGLHVCPGFIDIHSHSDGDILVYPTADSRVRQGITTEITGNCGSSAAPLAGVGADERRTAWSEEEGIQADWTDIASYCARVEQTKTSINQALLLGQGTLRRNAIGLVNRPLTSDELKSVLRAVEEGVDQGAFGLSTGLEYTPGRYTPTEEIVEMARVVARRGGLYASHIRNEEETLLEAVNEAIDIGRRAGVRVEISHLKAAGRRNWGKQRAALSLIESAQRDGIEALADAYPYTAYSTGLTIFLEDWALEGGAKAVIARLRDANDRARIRKETASRVESDPGDYNLIVISRVRSEKNRPLVGKSLAEIGSIRKIDPVDALLRLIEEEEGSASFIGHGMSPDNVEMVLSHPLVMIGSDGSSMAPIGKAAESRPHPRSYGTCSRVLSYYARERRLFDLPTAVKKMTSMPADQLGLSDRGRIARGRKADLVVFNAATVKDEATFENPHRYATGIVHVLVNGVLVVENGNHTGARPGRVLRKT
jgi:N-acyl-D-amino-acid deacylase